MKIAVLLRNVPDLVEELPLTGSDVDWDVASMRMNDFDDHALEECVLIKEECGAEIIAISLESAGNKVLQTAIARGADRAVKIVGDIPEGASSRELAPIFSHILKEIGVDMVVTGVQSPNDVFGQLLPYISHELNWPQVNGAVAIRPSDASIEVTQEYGAGRSAVMALSMPAAISVQSARQPPRYVSGSKLRQAVQSATIASMQVEVACGVNLAAVVSLTQPSKNHAARMISDDANLAASEIVELLKQNRLLGA